MALVIVAVVLSIGIVINGPVLGLRWGKELGHIDFNNRSAGLRSLVRDKDFQLEGNKLVVVKFGARKKPEGRREISYKTKEWMMEPDFVCKRAKTFLGVSVFEVYMEPGLAGSREKFNQTLNGALGNCLVMGMTTREKTVELIDEVNNKVFKSFDNGLWLKYK